MEAPFVYNVSSLFKSITERVHCTSLMMCWQLSELSCRKMSQIDCTERVAPLARRPFNIHTTYWNIKSIQLFFRRPNWREKRPFRRCRKERSFALSLSLSLPLSSSINRCSPFFLAEILPSLLEQDVSALGLCMSCIVWDQNFLTIWRGCGGVAQSYCNGRRELSWIAEGGTVVGWPVLP